MGKPRVLVVGQKPQRHDQLEREFGKQLRITFFYRGSVRHLQQQARGKDAVFVMTQSIDHMSVEAVRAGGATPRWVNGSVSQLRQALADFTKGVA